MCKYDTTWIWLVYVGSNIYMFEAIFLIFLYIYPYVYIFFVVQHIFQPSQLINAKGLKCVI